MALSGWEWIVLAGIFLAIFLWGPKKLPELARAIGEAKKEFDRSTKEITSPQPTRARERTRVDSDDILIETAQKLGIQTEGKTKQQISQEMVDKAQVEDTEDTTSS